MAGGDDTDRSSGQGSGEKGAGGASGDAPVPSRRRRRWPWVLLFLLLLVPVLLRVLLPVAVEAGAAWASRHWLGLPVRIDNADFLLIDGRVDLHGVAVGAAADDVDPLAAAWDPPPLPAAEALLRLERVSAVLSWSDLFSGTVLLRSLELVSPQVRVARELDGTIDPLRRARPLAPPADPEQEEEEAPASEPMPFLVQRFHLSSPDVDVVDLATGATMVDFALDSFRLDDVAVHGSDFSLGGIGIEGPALRVQRDLLLAPPARPAADPDPDGGADGEAEAAVEAAVEEGDTPGWRVSRIDVERATFTWVTKAGPVDVALSVKASGVSADEGLSFPIRVDLEVGGGSIGLEGELGLLPPAYSGQLTWEDLPFPVLLLASLPEIAPWLVSASSSGELQLKFDGDGRDGSPELSLAGAARVEEFSVASPGSEQVAVSWDSLEARFSRVVVPLPGKEPEGGARPAPAVPPVVAELESLRLVSPRVRYTHPSPALDELLGSASGPRPGDDGATEAAPPGGHAEAAGAPGAPADGRAVAAPEEPETAGEAGARLRLRIASVEIEDGDVEVLDTTVDPSVATFARDLSLKVRDLVLPGPSARSVRLAALLPDAAASTVRGRLASADEGSFEVSLQRLDLPVFDPYARAAGAALDSGQASLETTVKLAGARTDIDSELVLSRFGVSLRDPGSFERSFGMPIDLALALLRDTSGDIRLQIPVRIDDDGAGVSTRKVIGSALRAALRGALTAPLKLLGAAFAGRDGGGEVAGGMAPVSFVAAQAEPASGSGKRLSGLADLLASRPALGFELKGRTGPADLPGLAERILAERLAAGDGLPELDDAGLLASRRVRRYLLERAEARDEEGPSGDVGELSEEDRELFERFLASVEVPAERLDDLARARAEVVRARLVARSVDAARLPVADRDEDGEPGVTFSLRAVDHGEDDDAEPEKPTQ